LNTKTISELKEEYKKNCDAINDIDLILNSSEINSEDEISKLKDELSNINTSDIEKRINDLKNEILENNTALNGLSSIFTWDLDALNTTIFPKLKDDINNNVNLSDKEKIKEIGKMDNIVENLQTILNILSFIPKTIANIFVGLLNSVGYMENLPTLWNFDLIK
jgi:hypothetical protein